MTRERDGWILLLVLLAMLGLMLCLARPAHAQVTIADQIVARQKVVVGTTTATSSPLTVVGLPGSGDILRVGAGGSVGIGPLVVADIPSDFTRRNANEAISGFWTFGSGSLSFTNATSNFLIWPTAGVAYPTVLPRSLGTRLVLSPDLTTTTFDVALGIGTNTLWSSVATTSGRFAWFASDNDINSEPADQDLVAELTGTRNFLPGMTYTGSLGLPTRKWGELSAAALRVETLVAQDVIATVGGRVLVGPTNILTGPLTAATAGAIGAACFQYNNFTVGDTIYFEAGGQFEVMNVLSDFGACTAPNGTTGRQYQIVRAYGGVGAGFAWQAGAAAFNTGQVGSGFMDLYALQSIKTKTGFVSTELGPTIVGNVRVTSGSTPAGALGWAPRWAVGNLQGLYGYGSATFGSAFGDPSSTWVGIDATNGFRVMSSSTPLAQWDTAGLIKIGAYATNNSGQVQISSSSIDMLWRNNSGATSNAFSVANNVATGTGRALFNVSTETALGLLSPSVTSLTGALTLSVSSGHVSVDTTPAGTFRPLTDVKTPLGDSTHRWNNLHLSLPVQTVTYGLGSTTTGSGFPYVVTGDRADTTRLGYYCGVTTYIQITVPTGACASGSMTQAWQCGITTQVSCNP